MDLMQSFDAILFPADGRPPHVVSLMTSPASFSNPHTPAQTNAARVPHPEVHMEYIAEDPNMRAWHYQTVEALDMMNKKFANPYIVYYPVVSRDGMPFPVNRTVRDIQEEVNKGRRGREDQLWRGNLVAAKFADDHFEQMMDASMADFPILKNYLATHVSPIRVTSALTPAPTPPTPPSLPPPPTQHQHQQYQHQQLQQQQQFHHPHHTAGFPGGARHMQYAEPGSGHPAAYEREPAAGAHGVPVTALRRDPRTAAAEQHLHPMEL
ncbi:hypothetical protein EDB84DRAFT_1403572 [Lactarius hengduanensis]|nr:hypothetical protein EDB84DRAFT_1403572 [Lactarius hengduanensis]